MTYVHQEGCAYPNTSYGPVPPLGRTSSRRRYVPSRRTLDGFGIDQDKAKGAGLGIILGIGVILALVIAGSVSD